MKSKTFLRLHWRGFFSIIWPLVLLPILTKDYTEPKRCLFVILLMAGYWITDAIHVAVTSLIPIVLFPLFNIMSTIEVCDVYMKDAGIMSIAALILAIGVEHSMLHNRIALKIMGLIGCSPRKLQIGIMVSTSFISLWVSNITACGMMIPIIMSVLNELEAQGVMRNYEPAGGGDRRPTNATMCYYISCAFGATIGGMGTLIGTGTNFAFKGLHETMFPEAPTVDFGRFMLVSFPIVTIMIFLTTIILQVQFMGLFRPGSEDAKRVNLGMEAEMVARRVILDKKEKLGPMTFHETAVLCCFVLAVALWITRDPQFCRGWTKIITDMKIKDGTIGILIVLLMFYIPAKPNFIYAFSDDDQKRPLDSSAGLVTWEVVRNKMPWGLIFLLGAGSAIVTGATKSKFNNSFISTLDRLETFPRYKVLVISTVVASLVTQFTSNLTVATISIPLMSTFSKKLKIHPLYYIYSMTLSCSLAFMLPIGTPANAMAAEACNMSTAYMIKVGIPVLACCWLIIWLLMPIWPTLIWDMDEFPEWAELDDEEHYL